MGEEREKGISAGPLSDSDSEEVVAHSSLVSISSDVLDLADGGLSGFVPVVSDEFLAITQLLIQEHITTGKALLLSNAEDTNAEILTNFREYCQYILD